MNEPASIPWWKEQLWLLHLVCSAWVLSFFQAWRETDPKWLWLQLEENAPVETATVMLAVGACVLGIRLARRASPRWWVMVAFCFFVAGEEVTWGQGWLWEGHTYVLGLYVDNVHDLFDVVLKGGVLFLKSGDPLAVALVGVLSLGVSVPAFLWLRRTPWQAELGRFLVSPSGRCIALAVLCGVTAQLVDNRALPLPWDELHKRSYEEPLEMLSALAFCLAGLAHP